MKHLLVTNDFPPKIGGIQSLLWEWWRRLPPDRFAVLTSPYAGRRGVRCRPAVPASSACREPVLLPHPVMVRRVDELARRFGAELVVLDPAVPLGLIGPSLELPYDVVLHGAEVTVPGRLPGSKQALAHVLRNARHVIAAGSYPAAEADRAAGRAAADHGRAARRRHRPLPAAHRRPSGPTRGAGSGCPVDAQARARRVAARAAQGLRHRHPRGRANCAARIPIWCWRSPAAGATSSASSGSPPTWAPRCGSSAASPTTTCRASTDAPTCSRCCAATGGAGSSRRGSGSCSSRPRRAACRRSPATAGERPTPSPTARPASSSAGRTTSARRSRPSAGCSTTSAERARMGLAARRRAEREFSYDGARRPARGRARRLRATDGGEGRRRLAVTDAVNDGERIVRADHDPDGDLRRHRRLRRDRLLDRSPSGWAR